MTRKKLFYEQPSCDLLVVRFEENIMSPNGYHSGGGGTYDPSQDIIENGDY